MPYSVPTHGWIAARLAPYGAPMALALLGVSVTLNDGKASDDEVNDWYARLAATSDTVLMLNQHYRDLEAAFPFLAGHLGALTAWTENPGMEQWGQLGDAAEHLRDIAWSKTEPKHLGDLLGRVYNQMLSIGARRTKVFDYVSPQETVEECLTIDGVPQKLLQPDRYVDLWCGSGTRAIASHDLRLVFGLPTDIAWVLNDPSPIAVALAGLNCVAQGIGPDVSLSSDREVAEWWAASAIEGRAPKVRHAIPPEVLADIPAPGVRRRDRRKKS